MPEPLTTGSGAATYLLGGVTIASLLAGGKTGIVIGAFAGSVIYVLSASELSVLQRMLSFLASFLIGGQTAGFVTDVINYVTPEVIHAERPLGAVVASAIAVRVFMYISKQSEDPGKWFKRLRGRDHGK